MMAAPPEITIKDLTGTWVMVRFTPLAPPGQTSTIRRCSVL